MTRYQTIKPVVALDIDGTMGRWHEHFIAFLQQWLDPQDRPYAWPTDWSGTGEFSDHLGLDKFTYRKAKLAFRQGGYKRWMPVFSGAVALTQGIKRAGGEVWITTTRPWLSLDNIDPDTRSWLERYGFAYDYILFGQDKYADLLERVDADMIVMALDDELDNVRRCQELGVPAVLRYSKWNNQAPLYTDAPAVSSMQRALEVFIERKGMQDALSA